MSAGLVNESLDDVGEERADERLALSIVKALISGFSCEVRMEKRFEGVPVDGEELLEREGGSMQFVVKVPVE